MNKNTAKNQGLKILEPYIIDSCWVLRAWPSEGVSQEKIMLPKCVPLEKQQVTIQPFLASVVLAENAYVDVE